ncbi:MAG: phage portal protein [Chitinophagaceae bacterium]|nr:MAG: phage portal protein [Chitinophagaceae bacterium]
MNEQPKDNVRVFNFSSDKCIPDYCESVNRQGWINYGKDNLYPNYLLSLLDKSAKHSAIVKDKAQMIGGNGIIKNNLSTAAINFIKNPYNEFDLEEILSMISYDIEVYGGFVLNIVWSKDRSQIAEINYVDPSKVRIAKPDKETPLVERYWICDDWLNTQKNPPKLYDGFSKTNRKSASQILYVREYKPGTQWYCKPEYTSALNWIELEFAISEFHLKTVNNGFHPSMIISFNHNTPTDEEMDMVTSRLQQQYEGSKNAGKVIFTFSEGREKAPIITPIQLNDSDKKFIELNKAVEQGIFIGHRVTNPALFGVKTAGELGNTNELIESQNVFHSKYVRPKQEMIEKVFNRLAKINGVTDKIVLDKYKLDMDVKVNTDDILKVLTSPINDESKKQVFIALGYNEEMAKKLVDSNINPQNLI